MNKVLEVKNLCKSYGKERVLENVSFSIEEGKTLCIIGPSGSGKSTLLRCINNLENISAGSIVVDGITMVDNQKYSNRKDLREINKKIGMVFQEFNLFSHMSVKENIILAQIKVLRRSKEDAEKKTLEVLEKVGLKEKIDMYPCNLSGGQKQRVAIARCLAMDNKILCMDEPTSALDPELIGEVLKVIKELSNENKTMIIVTHEITFAKEIADEIIFMDKGIVLENGKNIIQNPKNPRIREFLKRIDFNIGEKIWI